MALAPVIDFNQVRPVVIARQLQALGVPTERITATTSVAELVDLWTRERTIASLKKLNGCDRAWYQRYSTDELIELERRTVRNLMGADGRSPDQLIYSMGGQRPKHPASRRREHLAAWGISA